MFPIEVGTWNASIAPWRAQYGRQLRGVGGMNKTVFPRDRAAVEQEVERLRRLIDLGGYIPCPDHRIAPDARFELVQYYCELMQKLWRAPPGEPAAQEPPCRVAGGLLLSKKP